jgi:thiosulfate/3-mercaptopyruvate sulfurtransferase
MSARERVLVDAGWVESHLGDEKVVLVEVDEDTAAYDKNHIRGAVRLDWKKDLQDPVRRDFVSKDQFEALLSQRGIANDDTVVLYGGNNNWFAAYAYWYFRLYGHDDVRLLDGGRQKWIEEGRELTTDAATPTPATYEAKDRDESIRVHRDDVLAGLDDRSISLVDVRSPQEFSGELMAPPGYEQEGAARTGHIPGAQSVPWAMAVQDDGTFKSREELEEIYGAKGVTADREVRAYCRIGERSAHTWFVLRELLGYENVKNYDGSWTEWGNLVDVPIER